jgi:hypothetical protein
MTRDHFKKAFQSPYFQSDYYVNETTAGKLEAKITKLFLKIFRKKQ